MENIQEKTNIIANENESSEKDVKNFDKIKDEEITSNPRIKDVVLPSDFSSDKKVNTKESYLNQKIANAQDIDFFRKKLFVKQNGKYVPSSQVRWNVSFSEWEKVVLYRDPGIMDNGWIYEGNGTIVKTTKDTKFTITNLSKDFLYKENEANIVFSEVAYQSRKQEYLKKYSCLSPELFTKYFSKDALEYKDWQWNIGNCYFVGALRALMESPNYETLIRTSVKIDLTSNGPVDVKLPLWDKNSVEYKIYPQDLAPQKNRFYESWKIIAPQEVPLQSVKWNKKENKYVAEYQKGLDWQRIPKIMPKNREYLYPLKWPVWLQIIEAAYIKMKDLDNNDQGTGGFDRLKMEWWFGDMAIIDLIWENQWKKETVWTTWSKSLFEQNLKSDLYDYFDGFNQYKDYGTLASRLKSWKNDTDFYEFPWVKEKIAYKHAYTIVDTDPINKTVSLVNPRKLDQPFKLTYEQASSAFSSVLWIWVDFDKSFV